MIFLSDTLLNAISGGSYITAGYQESSGVSYQSSETYTITFQYDGSMPPEIQAKIDAGASWTELAPVLTLYSMAINDLKTRYPERFTG